ncbi:MFS transporter [Dyella sp. M7H15-1]|uniref:MFS transporter n=1 Tax=Dyella sp. M7H15-1 TaxID=2501295 RepID=UPI001004F6E8|nr:MFS transporter [Dyella sp. M7H15-1]QAU22909.1 MFS transporter [Dyella sp. M7H15-1]
MASGDGQASSVQALRGAAAKLSKRDYTFLDDVPLNGFHCKMAGLTFGAHFTEGYALGTIGYALPSLSAQMELDAFWHGLIGSSALAGIFIGSLLFGWLSDRVGRQKIFLLSFLIITTTAFAQFFVDSPLQLCIMRVLLGFGMGGDFAVGHAILAEFSPRKHRGMLLGSFSVIWTIGYVAANLIGMQYGHVSPDAWRWLLASAGLPALIVLILRMGTPESPRWLLGQGRLGEAQAIVRRYFGAKVRLDTSKMHEHGEHAHSGGYARLFKRDLIRRTLFNCIFFVCLVIPYFAIYTFLPGILKMLHLEDGHVADLLLNGFLILGAVIGIWLTIVLPRRVFLITSFFATGVALLALGLLPESSAAALIAVFALFTLVMSAVSNLVGVFPPECFPTEVRACGVGLAVACSRLGSAVGTFLLPIGVAHFGFQPAIIVLGVILFAGMAVSMVWAPETRNLRLNEAARA